ncbi:hypothetical protein D9M68_17640 [compost metagenome]
MYHLSKSIYVDSENRLDRSKDVITISPKIGFEQVSESGAEGTQLGYAQSLDELSPEDLTAMLGKALEREDRVMLYCDGKTYLRIYTMLIKAVMPNITLDVFRWIMLCKKATFNTTIVASGEPSMDVLSSIQINNKVCHDLFSEASTLQPVFDNLVKENPDNLSLEWRLIRLRTEGRVGKIPGVLNNILRRIALSNAHDAMDVWGRHLTREKNWDMAGADLDTLLNAPTVFEGCLNMPHLASQQLLRPGLYDFAPTKAWIMGMLSEAVSLMDALEDESSAKRAARILELYSATDNLRESEVCLKRVVDMFAGEMRIALAFRDTGKYDENLIRFILDTDLDTLKACVEGAEW